MAINNFLKSRSLRSTIMISFVLLSVLFMGGIGGISYLLIQRSGDQTITDSTAALEEQIIVNIEATATKNAEIINEKLSSAQAMVEYMASELEYLFSGNNRYGSRNFYYDYWFDNTTGIPSLNPPDTHWDSAYQIDLSWEYASYYYEGSHQGDYTPTPGSTLNHTLSTVASMDYTFQYIHENAPEFRWLYIALPVEGVDLFINYPGSILIDVADDRTLVSNYYLPTGEDWYLEVLDGAGDIVFTEPYFDEIDGVPLITIGRAVYKPDESLLGVICGDISIDDMVSKILDVTILESGYASLITSSGLVVAHQEAIPELGTLDFQTIDQVEVNNDSTPALSTEQIANITSGNSGILRYTRNNEERFLAFQPVGKGDYISLIILPVDEALAGIDPVEERMTNAVKSTTTIIWIIAGTSLVLVIVIGLTLTAYITKPFNHLIEVARSLSTRRARRDIMEGLMTEIDPDLLKSEDEFGELTRAFKDMIDSVQQQEREKNNH
ncbi:MAG TPA: methyl-accepting chemotaxis protein [candidate division Zixibacteria bacterium]|nr:methyl-accepting chemotaxis protein [candidate division Zixibacteria bacterium]